MGLSKSPYCSVQALAQILEYVIGDNEDKDNPFHWKDIKLNLPSQKEYDPSLPWIFLQRSDGKMACRLFIYCDDVRVVGPTKILVWKGLQRLGQRLSLCGVQIASRKRRDINQGKNA